MTFVRWSPSRNFMSVPEEIHHLFHEAFEKDHGLGGTGMTSTWEPPVAIYETDDALVLEVELPGVSRDAISVELHEHTLRLSGERTREPAVKGGQYQREEGRYGAFQRAFRLPTIVDQGKVQATYKNGVLALRLPKRNEVRPKGIPITG
jgi:HSP20 family protein